MKVRKRIYIIILALVTLAVGLIAPLYSAIVNSYWNDRGIYAWFIEHVNALNEQEVIIIFLLLVIAVLLTLIFFIGVLMLFQMIRDKNS